MMEVAEQSTETDLKEKRDEVLKFVHSLQRVVKEFDDQFERLPTGIREAIKNSVPPAEEGFQMLKLLHEVLDQIREFLASPLGLSSVQLFARYRDKLRVMVEVGTSCILASLFVVVIGKVLDVNDGEFNSARRAIEADQTFVKNALPKIETAVKEARSCLRKLCKALDGPKVGDNDDANVKAIIRDFEATIMEAKDDIDDCELKLTDANKKIVEALDKINVRMKVNGLFRGALIGGSALWIYHLIKWKSISTLTGVAFGVTCCTVGLCVRPPRYDSLKKAFNDYRDIHDDLHADLARLKRNLEKQEQRYEQDLHLLPATGSGGEPGLP